MPPLLRATGLCRYYRRAGYEVKALDDVSLDIARGEFVSLVGSSGSGKTTLLNLLAGLDSPTAGAVEFDGVPFSSLSQRLQAAQRASKIGMIFQSFHLISHYTALQNVETALLFNGVRPEDRRRLALGALDRLGLIDRAEHRPSDLSGGEQQRVAVARAIVKKPVVLFADEPTGNLDFDNARLIAGLLKRFHSDGLTVILVTHNREMAGELSDRIVRLHYGRVESSAAGGGERSTAGADGPPAAGDRA
jgi:putative ABC transport system ATP-binding protein